MGSGSDIAITNAKFILMSSNLMSILTLMELSQTVLRRIKFNFLWYFIHVDSNSQIRAAVYNIIGVPIAAGIVTKTYLAYRCLGVLYPASHYRLSPVWASLASTPSSFDLILTQLQWH
jgi:P-type Cu+ transporter